MPTIKDYVNKYVYDNIVKSGDRYKLLNYMKEVRDHIDDFSEIKNLNKEIAMLNNELNKERAILYGKSPDVQNAYYTVEAIKNNRQPGTGEITPDGRDYWKEYSEALRNFGSVKYSDGTTNDATTIEFVLDNKDDYNEFLKKHTIYDLQNNGVTLGYKGSKPSLTIDKANPIFIDILGDIYNLKQNKLILNSYPSGNTASIGYTKYAAPVIVNGYDKDGKLISVKERGGFKNDLMITPYNYYAQAQQAIKDLDTTQEEFTTNITVLPYITQNEADVQERYNNGFIKEEAYKKWREEEYKIIMNAIGLDNLTQYDIYADHEDNPVFTLVSPEEKHLLGRKLVNAINNNKIEGINAAIAGKNVGVYITIADDTDTKGNPYKEDSFKSGQRIFIKGAIAKELEKAFNARTEWRAYKETVDMMNYGYDYDLSNGDRIIRDHTSPTGWTYRYKDGTELPTNEDGIRRSINEDIIISDGSGYLSVINNREARKSGTDYNVKKPISNTDERAFTIATRAVQELNPNLSEDNPEYWDELFRLYNTLLDRAGYTKERMFTMKNNE